MLKNMVFDVAVIADLDECRNTPIVLSYLVASRVVGKVNSFAF